MEILNKSLFKSVLLLFLFPLCSIAKHEKSDYKDYDYRKSLRSSALRKEDDDINDTEKYKIRLPTDYKNSSSVNYRKSMFSFAFKLGGGSGVFLDQTSINKDLVDALDVNTNYLESDVIALFEFGSTISFILPRYRNLLIGLESKFSFDLSNKVSIGEVSYMTRLSSLLTKIGCVKKINSSTEIITYGMLGVGFMNASFPGIFNEYGYYGPIKKAGIEYGLGFSVINTKVIPVGFYFDITFPTFLFTSEYQEVMNVNEVPIDEQYVAASNRYFTRISAGIQFGV